MASPDQPADKGVVMSEYHSVRLCKLQTSEAYFLCFLLFDLTDFGLLATRARVVGRGRFVLLSRPALCPFDGFPLYRHRLTLWWGSAWGLS